MYAVNMIKKINSNYFESHCNKMRSDVIQVYKNNTATVKTTIDTCKEDNWANGRSLRDTTNRLEYQFCS